MMPPVDISTVATAVSLAMDAFSVSICIGLCHDDKLSWGEAFILGGTFGAFQFFMPLIGAFAALNLAGFLNTWTPWISAALIIWVAVNMARSAYSDDADKAAECMALTFKNIVILALATSLDALAVGFSIAGTGGPIWMLAFDAGIVTCALSVVGALSGDRIGKRVGQRAQYLGAAVLLIIAANIIRKAIF